MNIVKVSSYYSGSKALNSLYFSRVGNSSSVADMWQKIAGIFTSGGKHQIWYIRVLMYAE